MSRDIGQELTLLPEPMSADIIIPAMSFGKRLRIARERAGLGVNEVDRLMGKKVGWCSRTENSDRKPRIDTAELAARAVGTSRAFLTGDTDIIEPDRPPGEPTLFGEHPDWAEASKSAREEHGISEELLRAVAEINPGTGRLPRRLTGAIVADWAWTSEKMRRINQRN